MSAISTITSSLQFRSYMSFDDYTALHHEKFKATRILASSQGLGVLESGEARSLRHFDFEAILYLFEQSWRHRIKPGVGGPLLLIFYSICMICQMIRRPCELSFSTVIPPGLIVQIYWDEEAFSVKAGKFV